MTIGKIISEYRNQNSQSLRQFAEHAKLSHSYISALEKEKDPRTDKPITPTYDALKKIAKAMNMDIMDLMKILDDNQPVIINNSSPEEKLSNVENKDILNYLLKEKNIINQEKNISSSEEEQFWNFISNNKDILFK